jgi:hypothetical protein
MKYLMLILSVIVLSACQSASRNLPAIDTVVITPPSTLYNCPQLGKLPDPETLTNQQVADVIEKLYRYNKICGINMNEIRKFVEKAKTI